MVHGLSCSIANFPRPRIEPTPVALAGRFLIHWMTREAPGTNISYSTETFSQRAVIPSVIMQILFCKFQFQFSRSVVSDSLRPHEFQHARPPCPSPTPGVHSDSYPSSRSCHPAISSTVVPFSSCPNPSQHQSFPMSQLFA